MRGGLPGGGHGGRRARRWALVLAASFLAGLFTVGVALVVPEGEKKDEGAPSSFSPPPPGPAQPAAAPAAPSAAAAARLAIVVDDLGYNPSADARWLDVPVTVTLSVIPFGPSSRMIASSAKARGFGVLIHVPMEPEAPSDDQTVDFRLRGGMSESEMEALIARMAANVPEATGASSHMGSAFTRDPAAMERFARILRKRGFLLLDSLTTPRSVATEAARGAGVPAFRRDVFLDVDAEPGGMRRQWEAATTRAVEKGAAVLVCHARPETLDALLSFLPDLHRLGIQAARLEELPAPGSR